MGGLSIWHWLIMGIVLLLLFGKGRFSDMMGDVAKGLKSFKKGISEEDEEHRAAAAARAAEPPRRLPDGSTVEVPPAERAADPQPAAKAPEPREP
ncbi:MAG TPA: twin-arginine translocase TatA/TatE family subunit [Allosphingosinicella sp.]|nr:twin-arginine translocase TatA/TatE family subunit [Allosphingosinicella sp.]